MSKIRLFKKRWKKVFKNFSMDIPNGVSVDDYDAMIIWCEQFSAFITSARLG